MIYLPNADKIIVLDAFISKGIFVFNLKGKFLFRIRDLGDGPKEFKLPKCIAYANNEIIVNGYDTKLLFYSMEGMFIKEFNLKNNGLYFPIEKMLIMGESIYCYTNHSIFGSYGRVFKIDFNGKLESTYGNVNGDDYHIAGGDLIDFNSRILFSGIFDGDIFEINKKTNKLVLFSSIGRLTDFDKNNIKNRSQYAMGNITKLDFILQMGVIKKFLFIQRSKTITVLDRNGNVIREKLKNDAFAPKGYSGILIRYIFSFYKDGYIIASINQKRKVGDNFQNPTLIVYSTIQNK